MIKGDITEHHISAAVPAIWAFYSNL